MNSRELDDKNMMSGVSRTIRILEVLSKKGELNLESLAKETDLPKATLLRFLATLQQLGYVFRDDADRYSLTLRLFSVGSRALSQNDLISKARPFAKKLYKDLGETVHMGILEDNSAVYVLKEESSYTLRMYSRVGKVIPLYCTAIGKIFLAEKSQKELDAYLRATVLKPFTVRTIKTREALMDQLELTRKRGWAIDDQEHEDNIMCIAAPIRDYTGSVIASISVSWPLFRFNKDDFEKATREIMDSANGLSQVLGYSTDI